MRTVIILILWVGTMAGVASAILTGNNSIGWLLLAALFGWLAIRVQIKTVDRPEDVKRPPLRVDKDGNFWRDE